MKKRYYCRKCLPVIFLFLVFCISVQVNAADFVQLNLKKTSTADRMKVGSRYFWIGNGEDGSLCYLTAKSETGKGTVLDDYGSLESSHTILTDGKTVIYTQCYDKGTKLKMIRVDGTGKVTFRNPKGIVYPEAYFNDTVYYTVLGEGLRCQTLKTKKEKKLSLPGEIIGSADKYLYSIESASKKIKLRVFDCSKNKVIKTRSISAKPDYYHVEYCHAADDFVYFSLTNNNIVTIFRMTKNGKKAPVKWAKLSGKDDKTVLYANATYVYYMSYNEKKGANYFYRYSVKKKKASKTSKKACKKAVPFMNVLEY